MKTKLIGTEYQIAARGDWEQISKAVKMTIWEIENTQPKENFPSENNAIENEFLTRYLVPRKEEGFKDYKNRFVKSIFGVGIQGKLVSLLCGNVLPLDFYLTQNNGESILRVSSEIREREYRAMINATGNYCTRGFVIATRLRGLFRQHDILSKYETLDKLI